MGRADRSHERWVRSLRESSAVRRPLGGCRGVFVGATVEVGGRLRGAGGGRDRPVGRGSRPRQRRFPAVDDRASAALTGGFLAGGRRLSGVYVLELAGRDDPFAAREAASAASAVEVVAAGLATARGITDRVRDLAFTHRASALAGTCDPDIESARALLSTATVDRTGSVAVRAEDVRTTTGVDTQRAERVLGQALVDRGFTVDLDDPDHELRALFAGPPGAASVDDEAAADNDAERDDGDGADAGLCALGWLDAESRREFTARKTPHSIPSSIASTMKLRMSSSDRSNCSRYDWWNGACARNSMRARRKLTCSSSSSSGSSISMISSNCAFGSAASESFISDSNRSSKYPMKCVSNSSLSS